jgi:hypothetical protein
MVVVCSAGLGSSAAFADDADLPETLPDDESAAASPAATTRPPIRFEANLVAALALPFKGEAGATAFGFALTYGVGWGHIPVMLGLDFMSASSSADATSNVRSLDEQPGSATVHARNRTLYFDLWLRVQPPRWLVRPYIEGFIGTKLVQTQYALALDGSSASSQAGAHDWVNSIGWGAGVDLAGLVNIADAFSVTLGFRRLHSARAALDARADVAGQSVVIERNVAASVTIYMLGVVGRFDMSAPESTSGDFM